MLVGDNFVPEKLCVYCLWTITKNKERIQNFKETGDSRYIYQNKLDKIGFQRNMAYGDFKYLSRKTPSD